MKRLFSFAILTLALIVAAQAQYRPSGPPASVTSAQPNPVTGGPAFGGPGATVTSGRFSPVFPRPAHARHHGNGHGSFGNGGFGGRSGGFGRFGTPFAPAWAYSPTLVPVPVPVDADGNPIDMNAGAASDDEGPAYTVFERRSRSAIPPMMYPDERRASNDMTSEAAPEPPLPEQPATVLVFRDGHQLEITNYAIQSGTLFNLSDNGPRRIALADLDVNKTVKANDDRGVDFTVPAAR
jgi:hypothetical protein